MFGGDKARVRGIQSGVGVGDVLGRRVGVDGWNHERLGVGTFVLDGDLVSLAEGHPAISPPDPGDEETREWVAKHNSEVGGYNAESQRKTKLPECGAHNDVVDAGH